MKHHIFNLKREKNVQHPRKLKFEHEKAILPSSVDLRSKMPPIYDQGDLGSCTANAGCAAFAFDDNKINPSRLFLYYNERKDDGDIQEDAGSSLSECVTALEKYGVCAEASWPYIISKFKTAPPAKCYTEAKKHVAVEAHQLGQTVNEMKACLASGFPFILGIEVFSGLESAQAAKTGVVPMPHKDEKSLGGHAIVCCGYDDKKKVWIMRNSWSAQWGMHGYFTLPYAYLTDANIASDFWVIKKVSVTK